MKTFSSLLERFSRALDKSLSVKKSVSEIVLRNTKINLPPENITLKNGVLEISASPVAKNEILLKEGVIKEELKKFHDIAVARVLYK